MVVPNTSSNEEEKAITDERNRLYSAEEKGMEKGRKDGEEIGVLMVARRMI
ncbi:hypothetical protein GNF78_18140, partial [Clostridium perfringens]